MHQQEPDWQGPEDGMPPHHVHGLFLCWGWPLHAYLEDTALREVLGLPDVSSHRLGTQLHGDRHPDLSEDADKNLVVNHLRM